MRFIFYDQENRLRNGWWVLIFIFLVAAAGFGFVPIGRGLRHLGVPRAWVEPIPFLISLLATWGCTWLRREPLATVGFRLDQRWAKEFAWGALMGAGVMLAAAALTWAAGGVRFELDPARSLKALGYGAYLFLFVALFEETLFRGFLFQRLLDGTRVWIAQLVLALFFAMAHWGNPGMHGATKAWATLNIALAAVFLGLAYLRTRSLALPIGIHLGWNWTQGNLLGFGVSGTIDQPGWIHPVFLGRPEWLTGGAFGLEASVFGVAAVLIGIALLWTWKGSSQGSAPVQEAGLPRPESA